MIVITSASYIDQEFGSEFGQIPPAFLPVGNKRLYNYQIDCLPADERIVLTLPDSFTISGYDREILDTLPIEILPVPDKLSLGESVVCAINLSGHPPDEPLKILHGDTLISDLPGDRLDVVTLSQVDGAYNWAIYNESGEDFVTQLEDSPMVGRVRIANGYFAFARSGDFIRSVIRSDGNFIRAVNDYAREKGLTAVETSGWLDFGHLHTFYRSKARMTTQRAFNTLQIGPRTVRKSSSDTEKMQAEYNWFRSLPDDLRLFTPQVIRELNGNDVPGNVPGNISGDAPGNAAGNVPGYEIEYMYLSSLSELYVFGLLPRFVWRTILQACFDFLSACRIHRPDQRQENDSSSLFLHKTRERLRVFHRQSGIDAERGWTVNGRSTPGLAEIAELTGQLIADNRSENDCVIHGDFCFSNILFDFRTQSIRVIDPRGRTFSGHSSIFGDQRYDLAKLAHSVLGLYDFIVAGVAKTSSGTYTMDISLPESPIIDDCQEIFGAMALEHSALDRNVLYAMQVQLFLSMIPLHADSPSRQTALLANALRLFTELD